MAAGVPYNEPTPGIRITTLRPLFLLGKHVRI